MYQRKYYANFRDIENKAFRLEIWEDSEDIIVDQEVTSGAKAFRVEFAEKKSKFTPVWHSSCSFSLLSETSMQFIDLITADMFQFQIRLIEILQITPIVTEEVLGFIGYLDSEMYEEPFGEYTNYDVQFRGTDGLSLLNRIAYTSDGDRYDTIGSQWMTLFNLFFKLHLPFNKLYVGLSTAITGVAIDANKTIFHYLYTNPDNWYNEDGDPETSLTVLEEILKPLGAFLFTLNGYVFITDYSFLLGSEGTVKTFKCFDMQDAFNFLYTEDFDILIGDLSDIGFADPNQTFSIVSGFNRRVIVFNSYKQTRIIDYNDEGDAFTEQDLPTHEGDASYGYARTIFWNSSVWNEQNGSNFIFIIGEGTKNKNKVLKGLRLQEKLDGFDTSAAHLSFDTKIDLPYVIPNGTHKLKLSASLFPKTWMYFGIIPPESDPADAIAQIKLHMDIIIDNEVGTKMQYVHSYTGDNMFNPVGVWQALDTINPPDSTYIFGRLEGQATINVPGVGWQTIQFFEYLNDSDVELKYFTLGRSVEDEDGNFKAEAEANDIYIPLPANCSGRVKIKIYDYQILFKDGSTGTNTGLYWDLVFKELALTIVDSNNNEVKKLDVEYVGDSMNSPLNPLFKNEGQEVQLYLGSNAGKYPCDNANILKLNAGGYYEPIQQFTRQGVTNQIEALLLRSLVSNYYKQFIQLQLTANKLTSLLGFLTYTNHLPGKKFTITHCVRDYSEATDEVIIQEFTEDTATITLY